MSYEKVKNISVKNRTITSACNNLRPLTYETWGFHKEGTDKEFIKLCLLNIADGNFHTVGNNCWKYDYAILKMKEEKPELYNDLYVKRWEAYDYERDIQLYTEEEIEQATFELGEELYKIFMKIKETKGDYIIRLWHSAGLVSVSQFRYKYCYGASECKHFESYEKAYLYSKKLKHTVKESDIEIINLQK